jgi:single-stranded-DNA-specific exonuclease
MANVWLEKAVVNTTMINDLALALSLEETIARLLILRGIQTFDQAREFFRPDLSTLHDPFLMQDMDKAVSRVIQAIEKNEKVLVYGDYDVDGTTSVTLVYTVLTELGLVCDYYIPDRYKEGYGFSYLGVDYAHEMGATLIITLDCGVRDGEKVKYASSKGIDVIVCDHHHVVDLPPAVAVLDPHRPDCTYPFKGLSGCGVGFKMLQGLFSALGYDQSYLWQHLDLLTISIGADIVPLNGENRVLAFYGLQQMAQSEKRPGIQAMLSSANFNRHELTISDVVFILAPRINAAGRIYSGKQAVELLLAPDLERAMKLSPNLEEVNGARKELDRSITTEALHQILEDDFYRTSFSTVVAGKGWHKGVVGIVASRLIENHYKPTIVLVDDGEKMVGSARSIHGLDMFELLDECADLLEQFGGHTMAAGLTLKSEKYLAFREKFDQCVSQRLNNEMPQPFIEYDAEIELSQITPKFYRIIKQFNPYGPENMRPVFLARNVRNARFTRAVGQDSAHLKLHIMQGDKKDVTFDGIAFGMGKWADYLLADGLIDMVFSLDENHYNGSVSLQLVVKDMRKSEAETL